jgi:hypothetical protein
MIRLARPPELGRRFWARWAFIAGWCLVVSGFFAGPLQGQQPGPPAPTPAIPPVVATFDAAPASADGLPPSPPPATLERDDFARDSFSPSSLGDLSSMPAPLVPSVDPPSGQSDATPPVAPTAPDSGIDPRRYPLEASWTDGFRLDSPNQNFHLHFGGMVMIDSVWMIGPPSAFNSPGGAPSSVGNASATFLRRGILQADGDLFDQFDFAVQFDFANASADNDTDQPSSYSNLTTNPVPLNVWMQVRDVP